MATYTLISSQTLSSSASSVTFSSIPQTYTDLVLKVSARTDGSGVLNSSCYIQFNSDSATNYSVLYLYGQNTSTGSGSLANKTYQFYDTTGTDSAGNTSNTFSSSEIYIPNYTLTSARPISIFHISENNSSGSNSVEFDAGLYRGSSAITSLVVNANGVNFVTYSSFYLYGVKSS